MYVYLIKYTHTCFLASAKVKGPDSLYCGKWGYCLKVYSDLHLDPTMPDIKLLELLALLKFPVSR